MRTERRACNRTVVYVRGTAEEAGDVALEHGQRGVQVLQHANDRVLAFHGVFGPLQGADRVEWPERWNCYLKKNAFYNSILNDCQIIMIILFLYKNVRNVLGSCFSRNKGK